MTISHIQMLTPQMRRVLQTCRHHGGSARFNTADIHERTVIQLSLRGLVTTRNVEDTVDWRYNASSRSQRARVTVAYDVTLTPAGDARAEALDRA